MRELIEHWVQLGDLTRDMQFATLAPAGDAPALDSDDGLGPLVERAGELGIDRVAFGDALRQDADARGAGAEPSNNTLALVADRRSEVERELANHPPGIPQTEVLLQVLADTLELSDSDVEAYGPRG